MGQGFAVVVDIGKTRSKVTLWSRDGAIIESRSRANDRCVDGSTPCLDLAGMSELVLSSLNEFSSHPVEYIVPVAHGAAFVAIENGGIAFAPYDYEAALPDEMDEAYRSMRPPFAETGSPGLPAGLNLGAQLLRADMENGREARSAQFVPLAQYWAWYLTGETSSEITSFGCHSDLWNLQTNDFSTLAKERGWDERFAPLRRANEVVGTIRPELAEKTGLSPEVKVLAGLHDSNAALLAARGFPEIEDDEATVLSTGTWFIAMRLARSAIDLANLPEARDCLVNIDPFGNPVPSARFMGGREIETLIELDTHQVDITPDQPQLLAAVRRVLDAGAMVLPTLSPGNGPYPDLAGGWVNRPDDWFERRAAACLYAALVADTSLDLIGSHNKLLVEGRFAEAEVFVRALASLRPETQVFVANAHNDVSFGAMRLIDPSLRPSGELRRIAPLAEDLSDYRQLWHRARVVPA